LPSGGKLPGGTGTAHLNRLTRFTPDTRLKYVAP
jgi:hypothetical protein